MIISKPQVQDACRGHITYPKIKILRTGEIEKFSCTTGTKSTLVYKNYVERTCYSRYEKTYNSPLLLYDFVSFTEYWLHSSYKCNLFTIVNKVYVAFCTASLSTVTVVSLSLKWQLPVEQSWTRHA